MKKQKSLLAVAIFLLAVFAVVAFFTFHQSNSLIQQGYLASEGNAAEDFAVLTAENIHLSDARVAELKAMTYAEMQESPENTTLRDMMSNENFISRVDYAYVMLQLPRGEVKYYVTEDNSKIFDAPLGTPLDIMWLLDVAVSRQGDAADSYVTGTDDEERYSYYIEEDKHIFANAPTYIFNDSEWGSHICGYAPLYSNEGTYIGVVGVELQTNDYDTYRVGAMRALGLLLAVSTITLLLLVVVLYRNYSRMQFDKIYTDPLTQLSNRSFYNDRFIRCLNGEHRRGPQFALMIADIDWFKKVNDTFGHEVGDEVLTELGRLFVEEFGKKHAVRFGGEEFVVGLWVQDEEELRTALQKLYVDVASRKFTGQQLDLTLSLGCCLCPCTELTGWRVSAMLKIADDCLYEIKESGRNAWKIAPYTAPEKKETPAAEI